MPVCLKAAILDDLNADIVNPMAGREARNPSR
jgi:hypothetical protein